ncbi:hypothetical protein O181_104381, partial [Austropuccinia psidii MF-1]|nr:hypothetical protein [Austropuccinia psidii MF-1]
MLALTPQIAFIRRLALTSSDEEKCLQVVPWPLSSSISYKTACSAWVWCLLQKCPYKVLRKNSDFRVLPSLFVFGSVDVFPARSVISKVLQTVQSSCLASWKIEVFQ